MTLDDVWRTHRRFSVAASRAATTLDRWRLVNLVLILTGALLGAAATLTEALGRDATRVLGAVGALALAVAAGVQQRWLTAEQLNRRVLTRAAAESFKGLAVQYLAAVAPFDGTDRDTELVRRVEGARRRAASLAEQVAGVEPDDAPPPRIAGLADYVSDRAQQQRDWHEQRAVEHRGRADRLRRYELAMTLMAAVLVAVGAATGSAENLSPWVGVATTASAAFAAHLTARQHDRIAGSYARTAYDLDTLLSGLDPATASPAQGARFVAAVESALAAQNEAWVGLFTAVERS